MNYNNLIHIFLLEEQSFLDVCNYKLIWKLLFIYFNNYVRSQKSKPHNFPSLLSPQIHNLQVSRSLGHEPKININCHVLFVPFMFNGINYLRLEKRHRSKIKKSSNSKKKIKKIWESCTTP